MEPKNIVARRKAFLNFLLLFVLSTAIIVLLSFFSTRTPLKHNETLEKQVVNFEREKEFTTNFYNQMLDIVNMIESTSKSAQPGFLETEVEDKINKLHKFVNNDSVNNKMLFQNVVLNLSELHAAKKQNRNTSVKNTADMDLQKQITDLQTELLKCQRSSITNRP